jgi:hypothetical protein
VKHGSFEFASFPIVNRLPNRVSNSHEFVGRFAKRPSSGIAGWRGGWIALIGSEGTLAAALLPAGTVPERWNVKMVFIENLYGPAINFTSLFAFFISFF